MNRQELLIAYRNGIRVINETFINEDLSEISLNEVNFTGSYFENCNFSGSYFWKCDFSWIIFIDCNLSFSVLSASNCTNITFRNCNLEEATITNTFLINACFKDTDLKGASFTASLMWNSDLSSAKNISKSLAAKLLVCPETGSFRAYKQLAGNSIALLEIPASAKRSNATTRKCRASKAKVIKIWDAEGNLIEYGYSLRDSSFIYKVGKTVEVKDFDENRWNECSAGIHFFMTKQEAIDY